MTATTTHTENLTVPYGGVPTSRLSYEAPRDPFDALTEEIGQLRASTVLSGVSEASGVIGAVCAGAVVFGGASVGCAAPALAVSAVAGGGEAVALLIEGDESGPCKAAVAAVDMIVPGPSLFGIDAFAEGVFDLTRSTTGFGAGWACD